MKSPLSSWAAMSLQSCTGFSEGASMFFAFMGTCIPAPVTNLTAGYN
jgi:hypothetical protein